jgi:hypothetical protein
LRDRALALRKALALPRWAISIDVDARMTLPDPPDKPEAATTKQRAFGRRAFS